MNELEKAKLLNAALELSKNEIAMDKIPPLPLNVLVANTQGAIGYMIQQSLQNALYKENSQREVVTFVSQMKINRDDPSLKKPSKFILYSSEFWWDSSTPLIFFDYLKYISDE